MKDNSGHFYEITPLMDIDHFVSLLLATLAVQQNQNNYKDNTEKK